MVSKIWQHRRGATGLYQVSLCNTCASLLTLCTQAAPWSDFTCQGSLLLESSWSWSRLRRMLRRIWLWRRVYSIFLSWLYRNVFCKIFSRSCPSPHVSEFTFPQILLWWLIIIICRTIQEIIDATTIFQSLGMGPAIGSTDCTHIDLGNCPNKFKVSCTGKSGKPTMAYSLTCSHSRKIYHCSAGFFGSKNDKYISKLDNFITAVGRKSIYTDFEWTLDVDDTTTVQQKGVFLICDGTNNAHLPSLIYRSAAHSRHRRLPQVAPHDLRFESQCLL